MFVQKTKIRMFISSLFISIFVACGGEKINSVWIEKSLTADGKSEDWYNIQTKYIEKDDMKLALGLANNDTSFFVLFKYRDNRLARLLENRGMILWFGEKDKEGSIGILYENKNARGKMFSMMANRGMQGRGSGMDRFQNEPLNPSGHFRLIQPKHIDRISIENISNISAGAGQTDGTYSFEYKISLQKSQDVLYTINLNHNSEIKVGIQMLAQSEEEKEMMSQRMEEMRGRGSMGGGMRSGGGMRGDSMRGGDRPGGMMQDNDGKEFWFKVQLAKG